MESGNTRCNACLEPINEGASLCPACGSRQYTERLKPVATILKWAGGITALISLVMASASLSNLVQDWRDRNAMVSVLTQAAAMQTDAGDYARAWQLLDEALEINASSPQVREQRTLLAMVWLRNTRLSGDQTFTDITDQLLPPLYLGLVEGSDTRKADFYAHIGWSYFLLYREGRRDVDPDSFYLQALALDEDNVWANAMRAHNLITMDTFFEDEQSNLALAVQHFATALGTGRQDEFVRNMQLSTFGWRPDVPALNLEYLVVMNELRKTGTALSDREWDGPFRLITTADVDAISGRLDQILSRISLADLMACWEMRRDDSIALHGYITGLLHKLQGDVTAARQSFDQALQISQSNSNYLIGPLQRELDALGD